MCGDPRESQANPSPEARLSALLNKELGTVVTAREMRLFIRANWKLVTTYAHAIHDAD